MYIHCAAVSAAASGTLIATSSVIEDAVCIRITCDNKKKRNPCLHALFAFPMNFILLLFSFPFCPSLAVYVLSASDETNTRRNKVHVLHVPSHHKTGISNEKRSETERSDLWQKYSPMCTYNSSMREYVSFGPGPGLYVCVWRRDHMLTFAAAFIFLYFFVRIHSSLSFASKQS